MDVKRTSSFKCAQMGQIELDQIKSVSLRLDVIGVHGLWTKPVAWFQIGVG